MKWHFTGKSIAQKQFIKTENIAGQHQDKFRSDSIQACLDKCAFAPKQSSSRERFIVPRTSKSLSTAYDINISLTLFLPDL